MSVVGNGCLSRSATRVVAKEANGFHLLRIDGYAQTKTVLPGQKLSSHPFTVGGHSWRIDYYPNGRDASANHNAISVYLQLASYHPQPLQARYKFSLLDNDGNPAYELPAEKGSFVGAPVVNHYANGNTRAVGTLNNGGGEEQGPGCGHEEFIKKEDLERREHLVRDDSIVIRCDVGVTQIVNSVLAQDDLVNNAWGDEEEGYDHHPFSSTMAMSVAAVGHLSRSASRAVAKAANGFHLLRIECYSETEMVLPGQRISSEDFTVGDYSWRVDCYPNGRDTSMKSNAILLDGAGNAGYELPAETASFTSVSSMYNYHYRSPVLGAVDEQGPGCGHDEFIGREELERRREDLIRDDRVVLRCDVGVTQIEGSCLAADELSDEEEDEQYNAPGYGYGPPRQRRFRRRTDEDEYVKWCLTEEPRGEALKAFYSMLYGPLQGNYGWFIHCRVAAVLSQSRVMIVTTPLHLRDGEEKSVPVAADLLSSLPTAPAPADDAPGARLLLLPALTDDALLEVTNTSPGPRWLA
ncbi:hypothetical protein QYE76_009364 [Lolium multiflorum]|uniref:MATH domain-containing protein n=1 Tax=Lolium multiflorum TaxID=4521 RepID=A0AAD8TV44_LOLMU|nr:hypothetical protein QYE76_009364 [Lolium multiflorum]